jgi:uncharacterized protein YkwD
MARRLPLALVAVAALVALPVPSAGAMDLGRLLAPDAACPGQTDPAAPVPAQEQAMRCMTNYARERADRRPLGDAGDLDRSARDKANDIVRCDDFSHFACGRPFTYWMQRVGYIQARCWRAAENIAWGAGALGSVRAIFRAWVHSPEHLANLLGAYSQFGTGLAVGSVDGHPGARVWTQHFGSHCDVAARPSRRHAAALASSVAAG